MSATGEATLFDAGRGRHKVCSEGFQGKAKEVIIQSNSNMGVMKFIMYAMLIETGNKNELSVFYEDPRVNLFADSRSLGGRPSSR